MGRMVSGFLSLCALGLGPAAAAAQDAPAAAEPAGEVADEIIVEGTTERDVRQFLWRSVVENGDVIALRSEPICIGIDNAPPALADPVKARIEANLAGLAIARAEPGCRVNTIIVFHRDAHGFVNQLAKTGKGVAFGSLYSSERRRLIAPVRPVYAWHFIPAEAQQRFRSASAASDGQNRVNPIAFGNPGSRILTGLAPARSTHSFTVVDTDAIDGITIEQLGDYLTMQILVEFRPDLGADVPIDSILNLFTKTGANPDAPAGLSPLDRVILDQMYSKTQDFRAGAFRAGVAQRSVAKLDEEASAPKPDERP